MRQLKDKPIVVTGAGRSNRTGYGAQIAKDLYGAGAIVHVLGRDAERLQGTRQWARAEADRFHCHTTDVCHSEEVNTVFEEIRRLSGPIYGLVNNAAINPSRNRILETTVEDFERTLRTNLVGAFNCMKKSIPQMLQRGEGNIVSVTSIFSHVGAPNQTSYCPSKFGLHGLTSCAGLQYCREGIAANCVAPGYALTDLTAPLLESLSREKRTSLINSHAIRREIDPSEVSDAVLYLLRVTPATTASVIHVDGGFLHNPPR